MITKNDLIISLTESLNTEEKAMPVYTKHLHNTLFFSRFKREDQEKIKKILSILKSESENHKDIFEDLIKQIKGEGRDVY